MSLTLRRIADRIEMLGNLGHEEEEKGKRSNKSEGEQKGREKGERHTM